MASPFSLLVFASLLIPPGPSFSHLTVDNVIMRPIKFTMLPTTTFTNLPPHAYGRMELARGLERLAWSWAFLAALGSIWRTVGRLLQSRRGGTGEVEGLKPHSILDVRPVLRTITTHLLAWRLGSMQNRPLFNLYGFHVDIIGVLGVAAGLSCFWGEVGRILRLFGFNRDPGSGPSWTLSIVHIGLALLRAVLSWKVLVAAMMIIQTTPIKAM